MVPTSKFGEIRFGLNREAIGNFRVAMRVMKLRLR